jgi:hypothetical protein
VRIIPASVGHGQKYWRVIKVKLEGLGESGNDHTIYINAIDENCHRVAGIQARLIGEFSGLDEKIDEKADGDPCNCDFSYPMFGDAYGASVFDSNASESVAGMCMCGIPNVLKGHAHVNFRITFQRLVNP